MKIHEEIAKSELNLSPYEYSTYISLLLHYGELSSFEIKCDHRSIGYYAKTKDNRTLREAFKGLHEKGIIHNSFDEFPRGGFIKILLNEKFFNSDIYIEIDNQEINALLKYGGLSVKLYVYLESFKNESDVVRGNLYLIEQMAIKLDVAEKTVRNHLDKLRKENLLKDYFNVKRNRFVIIGETKQKDIEKKNVKPTPNILEENNEITESGLEKYLIANIHEVEEGMEFIDNQVKVRDGFVDIMAKDKNGKVCLMELKIESNCKDLIFQCAYYPTQFIVPVRMITICPDYGYKINKALDVLGYIEKKTYKFQNGKIFIENIK